LKRASNPQAPLGAEDRLMAAIRNTPQQSNVVQLQPRAPNRNWLVGLPLAASLLLGIYLGSTTSFDDYLPDSVVVGASDTDASSGFDDVEKYADGELT
jgi:hypothetical protein